MLNVKNLFGESRDSLINLELAKVMEGMIQCLIPEAYSKRRKNILPVQKDSFIDQI